MGYRNKMSTSTREKQVKSVRLSCRIRPKVKSDAEAAASLLGQSITDFAETALEEKAQKVLAENSAILLSEKSFSDFLSVIQGIPEKPSVQLRDAVAEYHSHQPVSAKS